MGPLVSILIPCYNARPWIAQCIQSAIDQTYLNKEIVVVDDGSTDGSLDVIFVILATVSVSKPAPIVAATLLAIASLNSAVVNGYRSLMQTTIYCLRKSNVRWCLLRPMRISMLSTRR